MEEDLLSAWYELLEEGLQNDLQRIREFLAYLNIHLPDSHGSEA